MKKSEKAVVESFCSKGDALNTEHTKYVDDFVTKGHQALYKVLANLHQLVNDIAASANRLQIIEGMRKRLRSTYGVRIQKNTADIAVVVKYVVRSNRKTAHVYSKVLQTAINEGIQPQNLADFITKNGGIERVRNGVVSDAAKAHAAAESKEGKAKEETFSQALELRDLGRVIFNSPEYAKMPGACGVRFSHLICTHGPGPNDVRVVASVYPSEDLDRYALSALMHAAAAAYIEKCTKGGEVGFYQYCKDHNLNMDLVHRWARANALNTKEDLESLAQVLQQIHSANCLPTDQRLAELRRIKLSATQPAANDPSSEINADSGAAA